MTLVQLANFVRVLELQSVSKAAAVIRIAQPALSRQIRQLEQEFGSPLLVRHAWGVTPTAAGGVLLERARALLDQADGVRDAVHALASEPMGRVSVAVPSSLAVALLPPLAETLSRRFPKLRPHFSDDFSAALHARALRGELDLAVLYEDKAIGPLDTVPLLAESLMLVGPPDQAIEESTTAEMLAGLTLIAPARPNRLRLILEEAFAQRPAGAQPIIEVDSLPAIIRMVERGVGFTVLPFSAVGREVERGALRTWRLQFPELSRTLLLARPGGRQPTPAATVVEAELRALVTALAKPMRWQPLIR